MWKYRQFTLQPKLWVHQRKALKNSETVSNSCCPTSRIKAVTHDTTDIAVSLHTDERTREAAGQWPPDSWHASTRACLQCSPLQSTRSSRSRAPPSSTPHPVTFPHQERHRHTHTSFYQLPSKSTWIWELPPWFSFPTWSKPGRILSGGGLP